MDDTRKTIDKDLDYLRQLSLEVDFENDNYIDWIKDLKEYCSSHYCYALAPVQIGIPKRLIYVKNSSQNMNNNITIGYDESIIYINPIILSAQGKTRFLEGCESCIYIQNGITIHYAGIVDRPYSIKIEYYDINGNKHRKTIEGFEATIFSHEFDHLNGVLHMDKSSEIFKMTIDEMRDYRHKHPYKILSKTDKYIDKFQLKNS